MTVLGPGAACCQQSDCDIDCGFDKSQVVEAPVAPEPVVPTVQVQTPPETVKVDSTDKPDPDAAPVAP